MCIDRTDRPRNAGFTLVEMLVAIPLALILVVTLVSLTLYTSFSFAGLANYVELESQTQNTLDRMIQDIREMQRLTDYTSNRVAFSDQGTNVLSFTYDPTARTLTRVMNSESRLLLKECDSLRFSIFQRTAYATNLYDLYPTTLASTNCKAVQVSWTCSRKILGTKMNSETVQSTKIILRN